MKQKTFSASCNRKLAYRVWEAQRTPRGIVVIVHGYTEHGGRYNEFAESLNAAGYTVFAHDHAGHGLSEGVPAHIDSFDTYVDDLEIFIDMIEQKNEQLPLFVFGQSMGGAISLLYTSRNKKKPAGLIVSAPAMLVALKVSPLLKAVSKILSMILPKLGVTKGFAEHLSRDPAVIEDYKSDPLVYSGKNRAGLGYFLLTLEERLLPVLPRIRVPICILQGTEDKIVDPEGARIIYENVASEDKTLEWFNALYHELLHEPEKDKVIRYILDWMNKRL